MKKYFFFVSILVIAFLFSSLAFVSETQATSYVGKLVKASNKPTVYYVASDGLKYDIPDENTYMSWYSDFSGIYVLSTKDLNAIKTAKYSVTIKPVKQLVKFDNSSKVYAVDVGYGQFDWTLSQDPRVVVIERTNIRYIPYEVINEKVDLIVADTSFISLKIVIPSAEKFMKDETLVLALIKPQFEAGKQYIGKGGVVKDPGVRDKVIQDIKAFFQERGYRVNLVVPSPVLGPKGNMEYILSLNYKENHYCPETDFR